MSYTCISDKLPDGKYRFRFKIRVDGKQFKHHETCKESAVLEIYSVWLNGIKDSILSEKQRLKEEEIKSNLPKPEMLFENFRKYLNYVDVNYSGRMVGYTYNVFKYFKECFEDIEISSFGRVHVRNYKTWRKQQSVQRGKSLVSARSINREIAELSKFFTWCIEQEIYQKVNPCFKQKEKVNIEREVYLTSEEIEELLDVAKNEGDSIYSAVLISLSTGFRRGELFALEWKDIDFKHSRIFLRASTTKNKKSRIVAVPDFLIDHLIERREKSLNKQGRVFQEWASVEWYRNAFERVRRKLSFNPLPNGTNLHIHDLRHIYAQSLRDMGISLQDISALCGHSSVSVTEKFYAQAGGKNAKEKVEKLAEVIPFKRKIS